MRVRLRNLFLAILLLCLSGLALAQSNEQEGPIPVQRVPVDTPATKPKDNRKAPPRSESNELAPDESSSKQNQIDVSAPKGDEKKPGVSDSELGEFHAWDPHKAAKCIEVADYYLKQGNTRAAISRYQEALEWKPRDAEATYKLGVVLEKTGDLSGALSNYEAYLKILPDGPFAVKAKEGITRLKPKVDAAAVPTPNPS